MATVIAINTTFAEHLDLVTAQMRDLGAPTLRCVRDEVQGVIVALEGSHRLAAAQALGLTPILQILDEDEMLLCSDLGYDDCGWFEGEPARAADIRDRIAGPGGDYVDCPFFRFAEIEAA